MNNKKTTKFLRNEKGNVAILTALASIPLFGMAGLALDYSRIYNVKTDMQSAVDNASLALASNHSNIPDNMEARRAFVKNFLIANGIKDDMVTPDSFTITDNSDGSTSVSVDGHVPLTLLKVLNVLNPGKYDIQRLSVEATVVAGNITPHEVSLVLDVTGSMRNDMANLRSASKEFVTLLKPDNAPDEEKVKIAVVPYVGAVNIGNTPSHMAWMDQQANSAYHGQFLESRWYGFTNPCSTPASSSSGGSTINPGDPGEGGDDRVSIEPDKDGMLTKLASLVGEFFGVSSAHAQTVLPHGWSNPYDCSIVGPSKVNHFDLFDEIKVTWKGCVEARPEPYDVTDEPPQTGMANTQWVPYFWPDETDNNVFSWLPPMPNNYMNDGEMFDAWRNREYTEKIVNDSWIRNYSLLKYASGARVQTSEKGRKTLGPNASCPDPLLPLTSNRATILNKIDKLVHYEGSGTNSAQGMVWGWRALSPGEPFNEGGPYEGTEKIIVIMTDGKNGATPSPLRGMITDYGAYGIMFGNKRFGDDQSEWTYENYIKLLDNRFTEACNNAKNAGVKVYTVTFGSVDADTRSLYQACASTPDNYANVSDKSKLTAAFKKIGGQINSVRLVK